MLSTKRKVIISIVLLTLIATATTGGISVVYMLDKMTENTNEFLIQSARSYGNELNGVIIGMESTVDSLTKSVVGIIDDERIYDSEYYVDLSDELENVISEFDNNDINAMSVYVRFDPGISYGTAGVFHSDINSDGSLEQLEPTNLNIYEESDREHVAWFYEPLKAKKPIWTEPYFNANVGVDMISYISPISVDGVIIGVVGVDINFDQLRDIVNSKINIGKIFLLDTNYRFLVHDIYTINDSVNNIDDGKLAFVEDIMTSNNYGIVDYLLNGESKILGYSKLKNNWTVVVAMTKAEAFYKLNRTILFLVFINSAITIIMTCFSIFIALYLNTLITRNHELEIMVGDRTHELIVTNEYLEESMAELENSQAELTMLNDQLQTSLEKVNEMQEKLIMSEKLSSMGELVTGVAHEINTPLGNSITMISFIKTHTEGFKEIYNSQGITRDMFNEYLNDQIDSISIVERALIRLKELVDAFKLITIDKTLIDIKQVQACLMIDDLAKGFDELLREGHHIINIDCEEGLTFTTYPVVLRQIFKQLISNSLLHGFEGMNYGVINIKIRMVEEDIFIDYSDNGKGISKNLNFKVFEPFYTTRRNKGNAGLGLHIVHNLVTKTLNGDIIIDSDLGNGVKFHISFRDLL